MEQLSGAYAIMIKGIESPLDLFKTEEEAIARLSQINLAGKLKQFEMFVDGIEPSGGYLVPNIDLILNQR